MERIRVYFDASEEMRLALKSRALREGVTVSALIEEILSQPLAKEVQEAKKTLQDRKKRDAKD